MPGTTILEAEATNAPGHCVWMLIDGEELVLPYSEFPWFKVATIQQIPNVLRPTADHLYWPEPDVDSPVESIRHPERPRGPRALSNPAIRLTHLLQCSEPTVTWNPQLFAGRR